jgi:hypothetical protein
MDCVARAKSNSEASGETGCASGHEGKFAVEIAASVLFGIPPLANAYHTSIVVAGEEYFFSDQGMCFDDKLISHQGNPTEKYEVGRTDHSGTELWWALQEHFRPGTYDLLRKNCNSFSDAALYFLLRKRLDKRYSSLETLGRESPELVRKVIYIPNAEADTFNLENVIGRISLLGEGKQASQRLADIRFTIPVQDHRIPHLPRPSIQRKLAQHQKEDKALSDITNGSAGPGARAKEAEARISREGARESAVSSRSAPSGGDASVASRSAPRKYASSQEGRQPSTPPRQPCAKASMSKPVEKSQSDILPTERAPHFTPRGASTPRNPDRLLTQRVYPTNRKAPGSDKENLTPRGANARSSRSKGPVRRFPFPGSSTSRSALGGA